MEILHIIGLCPDTATHPDLLDFLIQVNRDYWNHLKMNIILITSFIFGY